MLMICCYPFLLPTGFVYQAGFLIFSGFWLLFIIHLFIKLVFPIRARNLDNHRHRRKIHVIEIVGIVLVGLFIPSVIVGTTKYNIGNFPPTQCSSNADVSFHTLILPTIIVMTTGVILILLSFMSIHRVSSSKIEVRFTIASHKRFTIFSCHLLSEMKVL